MTNQNNAIAVEDAQPLAEARMRMWQAVIVRAVEEWLAGPERLQSQAEHYLFDDNTDFPSVCQLAGMDAGRLRARLAKFRSGARAAAAVIAANRAVRVNAITQVAMRAADSAAAHSGSDTGAPAASPQPGELAPGSAAKRAAA